MTDKSNGCKIYEEMEKTVGKIELLKDCFSKREDVEMAFIFGSYAKGMEISESDFDLAVYFKPERKLIEWEEGKTYEGEDKIWNDVEKIVGINTDLVVLNRAVPTVAFEILKTGVPLLIRDRKTYLGFYLIVSQEAEDFRDFIKDYWLIYERSKSLSEEDRVKLIERIQFLDLEIQEFPEYQNLDFKTYNENKFQRRNIERWIETLVNAAIDVAKIILASQKRKMPATYGEVLLEFLVFIGLSEEEARKFTQFAKLRNILAHEYLDIRFSRVKDFIQEAEPSYRKLVDFVKQIIAAG